MKIQEQLLATLTFFLAQDSRLEEENPSAAHKLQMIWLEVQTLPNIINLNQL